MTVIPAIDEARLVTLIDDPAITSYRWHDRAACVKDPLAGDPYFPDGDEGPPAEALAQCAGCPAAHECLATALVHEAENGYRFGWWGGCGPEEREALARRLEIPTRRAEVDLFRPADRARHLRAQKRTVPSIAAELGCTERTVYRYLSASAA